jgi:hypothetical protein
MPSEVTVSGPVFDGRAAAAARAGTDAVRESLANRAVDLVKQFFSARIKANRGVFLSTITTTRESRTYQWGGSWTRDSDNGTRAAGRVSRVYTMPVEVADPVTDTLVTTELAMYGPWLEGTGSRNETTRFKGYHGFREAGLALDTEAEAVASRAFAPYVAVMNR